MRLNTLPPTHPSRAVQAVRVKFEVRGSRLAVEVREVEVTEVYEPSEEDTAPGGCGMLQHCIGAVRCAWPHINCRAVDCSWPGSGGY